MWLDIDSSLQTNDSKWLDSFCDSTKSWLWLEKILDDSDSKGLWLWLDKNDSGISLLSCKVLSGEVEVLSCYYNFFLLQTTYLYESLEGLNSSLAQSDFELLPGEKFPSECLLREQNFGQFLVYEL